MQVRRLLMILNVLGVCFCELLIELCVWFSWGFCLRRGFVSKRDEAGGAVGAVEPHRQAAADVVLPPQAQGSETAGQEATEGRGG